MKDRRIWLCTATINWIFEHLKPRSTLEFSVMLDRAMTGIKKIKRKSKRRFSTKQLAAQRLFAKRARAGTLRKGRRRKRRRR